MCWGARRIEQQDPKGTKRVEEQDLWMSPSPWCLWNKTYGEQLSMGSKPY